MFSQHKRDYTEKDYARQAKLQDGGVWHHERYFVDTYLDKNLSTLEVGTGSGRLSFALEKDHGFTDITAVDLVEALIELADSFKEQTGSKITFQEANAIAMPFEDNSFDQVLAIGVILSHITDRSLRIRALKEVRRVLKPGGIFILNAHNLTRHGHLGIIALLMRILRSAHNPNKYGRGDIPRLGAQSGRPDPLFWRPGKSTLHYYSPGELVYDLISSGFSVVDLNKASMDSDNDLPDDFHLFKKEYVYAVAKKHAHP